MKQRVNYFANESFKLFKPLIPTFLFVGFVMRLLIHDFGKTLLVLMMHIFNNT